MHILITGLNGTLAPKVAAAAQRRGMQVSGWDRHRIPPEDGGACHAYLAELKPDAIIHLAMGAESWAGLLAAYAARAGVPFVFTSTAMVFDHVPDGPHAPGDERTAKDDYGRYKIHCEDVVLAAYPEASVVRIGWQIDTEAKGNNMLAHLDEQQRRDGRIVASTLWRPACSFMTDTAGVLLRLVKRPAGSMSPGVVHADSNAREGHTFDRIVSALKSEFARTDWVIVTDPGYRHDQRLVEGAYGVERVEIAGLSERLGDLQ